MKKKLMNLDVTDINAVFGSSKQQMLDELRLMSLEQIAERAEAITVQSRQMLSFILLEARERFPSNQEFGAWRLTVLGLSDYSVAHIAAMLNYARFARNHDMTKIDWTAALEIAKPVNIDVSEKVWAYAKGKNLPVAEVKRQISEHKAIVAPPEHKAESLRPIAQLKPSTPPIERVITPIAKDLELTPTVIDTALDNDARVAGYVLHTLKLSPISGIPVLQGAIRILQGMAYKHTR
jgi:hypothetical protein